MNYSYIYVFNKFNKKLLDKFNYFNKYFLTKYVFFIFLGKYLNKSTLGMIEIIHSLLHICMSIIPIVTII